MKKRKLSILGIFLCFMLFSCSDELEMPEPEGPIVPENFGITDARHYFEENAADLAPLRFTEKAATKTSNQPILELSPDWKQAMLSGHSGVSLVEVPIRSNSINIYTETLFKDGKKVLHKRFISRRRLVIARRSTGETDMFVITLVPLPTAGGDILKSMENFRYLGGGDFTGRVFCSTLDGKFVKAFGYTDGQVNGTLLVMKRSELEKHADEGWNQQYSSITLQEGIRTRAGTYAFDEGGGGGTSNLCPHGYPDGSCPICMDEVVVVACPYCHVTNGCVCSRCFDCGNKEAACTCSRCWVCGHKLWQCTCYSYPDPDPNPNPGGGGGGGGNVTPPPPDPEPEPEIDNTPPNPENFQSKILTPEFIKSINNELEVDPSEIPVIMFGDKVSIMGNAAYYSPEGSIHVSENMFTRNWTQIDMESIMYHEYVHARQDQVEGIVLPRNENNQIITEEYKVYYTEYDVNDAWNIFNTILDINNIPKNENQRNPLQEQQYQMYKTMHVDPIMNDYNNNISHIENHNKESIRMEVEAYQKQLSKYGHKMSAKYWESTDASYQYYLNIWNKIKNL